jgi:outer membrane lipoprotein LolB
LFLAACAGLPSQAYRSPRPLSGFALDGRITVRQGDNRHYANISWRHSSEHDQILLTTPLGQGVAELTRDASGARLVTSDGHEVTALDWPGLGAKIFGVRLPLDQLPDWLTGKAPSDVSGWRVMYLDYENDAVDALPTLIEVKRDDLELRLKIDSWGAEP